jgi:dynein heavy chain
VIRLLTELTKNPKDTRGKSITLLNKWKQLDASITEVSNEAKDNVKYLATLEKFIEPLYSATPDTICETMAPMLNAIKMVHTIARYYNTTKRMQALFTKVSNQMILKCRMHLSPPDGDSTEELWAAEPSDLVKRMEHCLKLNESYQEQYRFTKDKLQAIPRGKQFDFNQMAIFGKFDLFSRRLIKLIDMFSTIHQFQELAKHNLEGMDDLLHQFHLIKSDFMHKRHDLLSYSENAFDRDYVEFNVQISGLETSLQDFVNQSFNSITNIDASLAMLKKFQKILQRESLKADLDHKFTVIFQNYGIEVDVVHKLYENNKHAPSIPRNVPPVSGNILWARHLLERIEGPMKKFEKSEHVLSTKDAKRIIRNYNKVS